MRQLTLVVANMHCRRCVRKVTRWLRDVPGVETVAVDADAFRVHLTGTMTEPDVRAAFVGTTYVPTVVDRPAE